MENEQINNASSQGGEPVYANLKTFGEGDMFTPPVDETQNNVETQTQEPAKVEELKTETPVTETTEQSSLTTEVTTEPKVEASEPEYETDYINVNDVREQADRIAQDKYDFISYEDVVAFKELDFSDHENGVGEMETIIEWLKYEDPEMEDVEIEVLEQKFAVLFQSDEEIEQLIEGGKLTEAELKGLHAEFARTLRTAERGLKEAQDKINLDDFKIERKTPKKDDDVQSAAQREQLKQAISNQFNQGVKDKFSIVKDGKEVAAVEYQPSAEAIQKAVELGQNLHSRWINTDGTFNSEQYAKDLSYLVDRERINALIYNQGVNAGAEAEIKKLNNIEFNKGQTPPNVDAPPSLLRTMGI